VGVVRESCGNLEPELLLFLAARLPIDSLFTHHWTHHLASLLNIVSSLFSVAINMKTECV